jgi:hypothetical protein
VNTAATPDRFEVAVERACVLAEEWFRTLPPFEIRVNLGSVVGHRSPWLLSERDCVVTFIRFLVEDGLEWEEIHNEVPISRWIFDKPHPAATAVSKAHRRVDLVLVDPARFAQAELPATTADGFRFDTFLEFGFLGDWWQEPKAVTWNDPRIEGQKKVAADVDKIDRHLAAKACRLGYVIVFEECDHGFEEDFAARAETAHGCRVRFIRTWTPTT